MKIITIVIGIFLSACASLGPRFESFEKPTNSRAVVYVYRPSAFTGSARAPDIVFNGEKVGTAANGSYFFFESDPIQSKFIQRNFVGEETGELEVQLKGGQVYFLRMDLGIPNLKQRLDAEGKSTGQNCPFQGLNLTLRGQDVEVLRATDKRVQTSTCWAGFMFVTEELARRELLNTYLSK